ncbi:MAG: hypothetical protein IKO73_03160 [Bacteroidaceae bacterium]|nr:hypothetical protein [Bacteroidaceae bacterium]
MLLFLDINTPNIGWEGFDYRISGGKLQRYDAVTQQWHAVAQVAMSTEGNHLTIKVPRKTIHLKGNAFTLDFKWADNPTEPSDIISVSTTGDTAPNRRFRYHFQWQSK